MLNAQEQLFGCDIEEFVDDVVQSLTYQACGANMVIAGLMSDAQEEIASGRPEAARQTLNRAKALLSRVMQGELVGQRGIRK